MKLFHNTLGVNGQNTQWWIANSSGLDGDQVIIAWIHSHVQGMQCCFSSIDVHSQHAMQIMYPDLSEEQARQELTKIRKERAEFM